MTEADERRKRIVGRVHLLGGAVEAFVRDVFRIIDADPPYQTRTNLVGHRLREVMGSMRVMLLPSPPLGKLSHRDAIVGVLEHLGLSTSGAVLESWLRLDAPSKNTHGLHAYAHRRGLAAPRRSDAEFRAMWDDALNVLDHILERVEAKYLVWVQRARSLTSSPLKNRSTGSPAG